MRSLHTRISQLGHPHAAIGVLSVGLLAASLSGAALTACSSVNSGRAGSDSSPSSPAAVPHAAGYLPASALATPNANCLLYPEGGDRAALGIPVTTDGQGVARFLAVRASAGDRIQKLALDCTDAAGQGGMFSVDLRSDATFAPHPQDVASLPGADRPALAGDPLSYSQAELLSGGYGLRPDPQETAAYGRWLEAASRAGRRLKIGGTPPSAPVAAPPAANTVAGLGRPRLDGIVPEVRPASRTVTTTTGGPWVGSVMTGAPLYDQSEMLFTVPTAIPGSDGTTNTTVSIWNGLGGYNSPNGLIQGGVNLSTTPSAATYANFREYCCGDPKSNGYQTAFTPKAGDLIYSVQWYCDAQGNPNVNGGYGCSILEDESTTPVAVLSCTSPTDPNCWSVPALPNFNVGNSAEFIVELQGPVFSPMQPFTMHGTAHSATANAWETVATDPTVTKLIDFTRLTLGAHLRTNIGPKDETYFFSDTLGRAASADYDGDGLSDLTVFRPSSETWFVQNSSSASASTTAFGLPNDIPLDGDFDGDGKTDLAVWRPSDQTWYIANSSSGLWTETQWGIANDAPVPGDFDGDGRTDLAVWRSSNQTWYVLESAHANPVTVQWGIAGDVPQRGDYDGDGKSDFAVFRPSTQTWYVLYSSTGAQHITPWGIAGDEPVPGDYDGDGKTDLAVWRPSTQTWYVINSAGGANTTTQWGISGDVPVVGDYDGDGKTDLAVWRPSNETWYVINSSGIPNTIAQWGISGDQPMSGR